MADASLDDFFAKKDKSKKKSKKAIDGDILGKGDEEPKKSKKKDKKKKEKENNEKEEQTTPNKRNEEPDWIDFEEEKEADYTGLRIATLQLNKEQKEDDDEDNDDEMNGEDGETERRVKGEEGPWNKAQGGGMDQDYEPPPRPEPPKPAAPVSTSGKYVPPSMRGGGGAATMSDSKPRRKKEAPNIKSESDFPTLGGGPADGGGMFEEVQGRGSNRQKEDPSKKINRLELGNKFGALQDHE